MAGEELRGLVGGYAQSPSAQLPPLRERTDLGLVQVSIPNKSGNDGPLRVRERVGDGAQSESDESIGTPFYEHTSGGFKPPDSAKPVPQTFTSSNRSARTTSSTNSIRPSVNPPYQTYPTTLTKMPDEYPSTSLSHSPVTRPVASLATPPKHPTIPLDVFESDYLVPSGVVRSPQQAIPHDSSDSEYSD